MTGRRVFLGATLIAALAIIAVLWGMEMEANRRLREEAADAHQTLAQLALLEVDNVRLSNIVARATTPLAEAQLAELATLREEVKQLQHRTNDLQTLRVELRRLRAQLTKAQQAVGDKSPPDVPPEDIFPRDAWKMSGYDTPEAAIQSVNWAIGQGDEAAYLGSLAPTLRDQMQSQLADGSFADIGPMEMAATTGFRIVDRQTISDTQRVITVYLDGDGGTVTLMLIYTKDGWKILGETSVY